MRPAAPAITERYELVEPLHITTLFSIYLARERSSGILRLIVVPRAVVLETEEPLRSFREAAERVQQIVSPHLLPIHEIGHEEGQSWVIYEYDSKDVTVEEILARNTSLATVLELGRQAAEGLGMLHAAGIVHGDIRPSTVIWREGERRTLLWEFGETYLAHGVSPLVRESLMTPLPAYLAPELAHHDNPTVASDIYSLGCLLYELVTGHPPFSGTSAATVFAKQRAQGILIPTRLNPELPQAVESVILRALAQRPQDRYASAGEMAQALQSVSQELSPEQCSLHVPPTPERSERVSMLRRHPASPEGPAVSWPPSRLGSQAVAEERAAVRVEEEVIEGFIYCPLCHQTNHATTDFCTRCWYDLSNLPVIEKAEADRLDRRYRRRRLIGRALRWGIPASAIGVVAFLLFFPSEPPGIGVPAPRSSLSAVSGEGEWASFNHDPQNTGFVNTSFPVPTGEVRWTFKAGGIISAAPVTAGNQVYVAYHDNHLAALDQETGELLWRADFSGPVRGSATVAGDLVFVGQLDAHVTALRRDTGQVAWRTRVGEAVIASVLVMNGVVYVPGLDGTVFTLDAETGEHRWSLKLSSGIQADIAYSDGSLLVGSGDRRVFVVDAETGEITLEFLMERSVEAAPTVDRARRTMYVGNIRGQVWAINIEEQNKPLEKAINRWWGQLFIWGYLPPPIQSGTVWLSRIGSQIRSSPALAHGRVYVGTEDGRVVAVNAQDGARQWTYPQEGRISGRVRAPVVVVNKTVFVGTIDDNLYALDAETGEERWRFKTGGDITGGVAYAKGLIFLPSHDGTLYALE